MLSNLYFFLGLSSLNPTGSFSLFFTKGPFGGFPSPLLSAKRKKPPLWVAKQGEARRSKAKQGEARRSKAKQGEARRSKAKQGTVPLSFCPLASQRPQRGKGVLRRRSKRSGRSSPSLFPFGLRSKTVSFGVAREAGRREAVN